MFNLFSSPSRPPKRPLVDENTPIQAPDTPSKFTFTAGRKKRRQAVQVTDEDVRVLREKRAVEDAIKEKRRLEDEAARAAAEQPAIDAAEAARLRKVLKCVADSGYAGFDDFFGAFMSTNNRALASQMSNLLVRRGADMLDAMHARNRGAMDKAIINATGEIIAAEGVKLAWQIERFV